MANNITIRKDDQIYTRKCECCGYLFSNNYPFNEIYCPKCEQSKRGYKPIESGNSYGVQFLCSCCNFPKYDTLTFDMKYCWFCGARIDWSGWEENKK